MTQIKLIASDLDHTLLTEANTLPPGFYNTIRRLHDSGIHFVAASGRAVFTLRPMFDRVSDSMSLVAENGAVVIRNNEIVAAEFLKRADYAAFVQHTRAVGGGVPLLSALDTSYMDEKYAQYEEERLHFFLNKLTLVPDVAELDIDCAKYTVYYPKGGLQEQYQAKYVTPYGADYHVTIGNTDFLDIMAKGVNKGTALKNLGAQLGVTPEEMLVFGDNLNDTEMLAMAGHSYIVQDATAALEPYATGRIGSNEDYAVATMIEQVLANGGRLND